MNDFFNSSSNSSNAKIQLLLTLYITGKLDLTEAVEQLLVLCVIASGNVYLSYTFL